MQKNFSPSNNTPATLQFKGKKDDLINASIELRQLTRGKFDIRHYRKAVHLLISNEGKISGDQCQNKAFWSSPLLKSGENQSDVSSYYESVMALWNLTVKGGTEWTAWQAFNALHDAPLVAKDAIGTFKELEIDSSPDAKQELSKFAKKCTECYRKLLPVAKELLGKVADELSGQANRMQE